MTALLQFLTAVTLLAPHDLSLLNSPNWKVRDDATKRLTRLGWAAAPAATLGAVHPDPETRMRLGGVRERLLGTLPSWAPSSVPADFPLPMPGEPDGGMS